MSTNESLDQPDDISNLQQSFSKQQKKISALKELVRKSEVAHGKSTSSAQEKVKNIAQRLTHLKFKARSRQNLDTLNSPHLQENTTMSNVSFQQEIEPPPAPAPPLSTTIEETAVKSGSEKFQLLRQQMEENKLRMAQRASSKQHLEQLVTQLKEKFDSTQQCLEDTSELGKSMSDLSIYVQIPVAARERFKSATDLSMQSFSLEKERIKFLENRCRLLEKQLEKEKQAHQTADDNSVAEALNAAKQRTEQLEAKVNELELALKAAEQSLVLPSTKLVNATEMEMENERLHEELANKTKRITELEEVIDVLETTRFDLQTKVNDSDVRMQELQAELLAAKEKLRETETKCIELEESAAAAVSQPVRVTAVLSSLQEEGLVEEKSSTDEQVKAEMAKQIQEMQDKLRLLESENLQLNESLNESTKLEVSDENIAEKIAALEATIESQRVKLSECQVLIGKQEEELMEKTIELNVLNANFKVLEEKLEASNKNKQLFPQAPDEENNPALVIEVQQLKQKLDESNKAMIKLKLKCKQTEKQVEKLKKSSDLHAEVVTLQKTNEQLQQKITELEDEKGQWQLMQVEENPNILAGSSSEGVLEVESREKHLEIIRLLEQQKYEQMQEIEKLQQQLENREHTDRVKSEISEIKWEEQMSEQEQLIKQLQSTLADVKSELENIKAENKELHADKENLDKKIEHYVNENMELLNKVDKLSKSSSSAESIEIVERLTQQERAELAAYDKSLEQHGMVENLPSATVHELTQTEMAPDLSESLTQLREESSELMNKIELFTNERREVLDRMEVLSTENQELMQKIEELNEQRELAESNALLAENAKSRLEGQLELINKDKYALEAQMAEISKQSSNMSQELTSLQKTSEVVAVLDNREGATLFDKCEKSLCKLNSELEAYRKATDKGAKFNASKMLAKEAKNAYTQLSELLSKVKEASNAVETVTVVETVVAVTAPNGKALAEYEQLTAQNRDLKKRVNELEQELEELQDAQNMPSSDVPAIAQAGVAMAKEAEKQCDELRMHVDELRQQLHQERLEVQHKTREINDLKDELNDMQRMSDDFDRLLNDKEMDLEKEMEQMTRIRKELEGKCDIYEGEMEILQTLVKEQKQQLIEVYKENEHEINMKLLELQQRDEQISEMRQELQGLREKSQTIATESADDFSKECEKLREALRINKTLVTEQIEELSNKQETIDTLNVQISELYTSMEDNVQKVIEKDDKIAELEQILENNNNELELLRKDNNEQKTVVDKLLNELHALGNNLPQLRAEVTRLEKLNAELEQRNKEQLEKLKMYVANLKKRTLQCQEFKSKIKEMEKGALEQLQTKEHVEDMAVLQQRLAEKINAMQEIQTALQTKTVEVLEAEERVSQLEGQLHELQLNLQQSKQEIVQLQNALAADQITDNQIQTELTERNKLIEQQQQEIRELQAAKSAAEHMHNANNDRLQEQLEELRRTGDQRVLELEEELKAKALKFEKSKAVIKERNNQIQRLQAQVQQLQQQLSVQPEEEMSKTALDMAAYEALQLAHVALQAQYTADQSNFKDTIERLETLHAGIQGKLQEDMSYIETLEQDNAKYKDKICKLEEAVAAYEERRSSMERHASLLDAQMQTRADEYERSEDELVYRLNMLSEHDDIIAQRLLKTDEEKEALQDQMQQLQNEFSTLTKQHAQLQQEFNSYKITATTNLETEQSNCQEQLAASAEELAHLRKSFESKLAKKNQELEELDNELSEQMSELQSERRALNEQLERTQDECNELKDEVMRLQESKNELEQSKSEWERESTWLRLQQENSQQDQYELQELRMQSMQDKTELENLRHQIDVLVNNHEMELQALRTQISDLDTLRMQVGQNQTDDQVFIESENKRLTELLTEKQSIIDTYQREQHNVMVNSQHDLNNMQNELSSLRDSNAELQRQLLDKSNELEELRRRRSNGNANNASSDIIPAPAMFFATEQIMTSPFDEIVHSRALAPLEGQQQKPQQQQQQEQPSPTIEDLQRNVSDLEKHAQDLEHKLATRNQRDAENERRLLESEQQKQQLMSQIHVLEQQLQALEEQLQQRNNEMTVFQQELKNAQISKVLESHILPNETVTQVVPTLDMFFGQTASTEFEQLVAVPKPDQIDAQEHQQKVPVVEELIVPKKAYICQPENETEAVEHAVQLTGVEWGDDAWAGNEDIAAAVEHFDTTKARQTSLLSQEKQLELQLQDAQERVQELQLALERSEAQKQEQQVKSGKMMKKLKEYKLKLETQKATVTHSNSTDSSSGIFFDDLDAAIQDELKAQVQKLEARVAEQQKVQEAQTTEKEKLLQRIDVLEAGNERMAELKERQDMDVQMYQTRIRELQEKLHSMQDWGGGDVEAVKSTILQQQEQDHNKTTPTTEELEQLTAELQDVNVDRQELQALLDEERANVQRAENLVKSLQEQFNDLRDKTSTEQSLVKSEHNELKLKHQELQQQYNELSDKHTKLQAVHAKNQVELQVTRAQVQQLEALLSELQAQLMEIREKHAEILQANEELKAELAQTGDDKILQDKLNKLQGQLAAKINEPRVNDEIMMQLAEKDSEISHLKQQIEDLMREDQTEKLVLEILSKNQEIHMLKVKLKDLEDDKQELEHNLSLQLTQEMHASKDDALQVERQRVEKLEAHVKSMEVEKQNMEEELQVLNNHVMQSLEQEEKMKGILLELDVKNIEISELRNSLATLKANGMRADLVCDTNDRTAELNAQWEAAMEERCADIAQMWRTHLDERENEFKAAELQLHREIELLRNNNNSQYQKIQQQEQIQKNRVPTRGISTETNTGTSTAASETSSVPVSETSSAAASKDNSPLHRHVIHADDNGDANINDVVEKMQAALESQEMEIVTLKEQLAIRSAEYARLAAQYDPFNSSNTPTGTRRQQQSSPANANDANGTVPKSELDLALYMLHQRDMRCEEITLELVQLLEERDTLQLKLSNTLRQVEAMKSSTQITANDESFTSEVSAEQNESTHNPVTNTNTDAVAAEELNQKLSQLHSVSHSKDKVIVEERDQRLRQMEIMQQDVAKMPQAAVSELIGTDLSQSSESPSTLLLNWLWGNNNNKPTSAGNAPNS